MKLVHKYPILGSSVNPEKISLTVKSLGLALVPVILAILRMSGVETIVENDIVQVVNALATIISMVGVIIGIIRKIYN